MIKIMLKDVLSYYFPDTKFYTEFVIAGSGLFTK